MLHSNNHYVELLINKLYTLYNLQSYFLCFTLDKVIKHLNINNNLRMDLENTQTL